MTFEDALTEAIKAEMERFKEIVVARGVDVRFYDQTVGGYHALRLVIEEYIPEIRKKLNER